MQCADLGGSSFTVWERIDNQLERASSEEKGIQKTMWTSKKKDKLSQIQLEL